MTTKNPKARAAIRAAQNVKQWGGYAARRYAEKHGVTPGAYRVARECEFLRKIQEGK